MLRQPTVLAALGRATHHRCCGAALAATGTVLCSGLRTASAASSAKARKNPYKVLGISPNATRDEIKKAHRIMAKKCHPDAPGGNHEQFQEIQQAFEQIKTGVWMKPAGEGPAGSEGNRYSGFRYTTADTEGEKITYEQFYAEMHMGKKTSSAGSTTPDPSAANQRPMNAMGDNRVQAWVRLIMSWTVMFLCMRVALLVVFPPKHHAPHKKPQPRKPPPPPLSAKLVSN